jgi:hypothetical protein
MEIRPHLKAPRLATAALSDLTADAGTPDAYLKSLDGVYLYNKYRPQEATSLAQLRSQGSLSPAELHCLEELPLLSADGITRTHLHWMSPQSFQAACQQRQWDLHSDGHPVVDALVIGAGPAGLATSYHLAQKGVRTLVMEAGYAASAFSDAGAPAVHSMRTDRQLTSLVRTGRALNDLVTTLGLPANIGPVLEHTLAARRALYDKTGHRISGLPEGIESKDRYQPAARSELFEHFQQVAHYIGQDCPNSFLLERTGVSKVERRDGLFRVESGDGHQVWARKLVVASGLVAPGGSNARVLPVLAQLSEKNPATYLELTCDQDLVDKADEIQAHRQWIVTDRLLGRSQVKLKLHQLPGQARVAVIGSGESAIKAALEVLSQNPTLKVDLFTKAPLEAAQVQVPGENFHPVVLEHAVEDQAYAARSLKRFAEFDTPVTPRSLIEALDEVQSGRLRIHEMGAYFDEKSVAVEVESSTTSRIRFVDPQVTANLQQQSSSWQAQGIRQAPVGEVGNLHMVVLACGYERAPLASSPLMTMLQEQGLLEVEGHQPQLLGTASAACADLHFNGAGVLQTAADSAIPGMAVKGRHIAEKLAEQLPARSLPPQASVASNPGADWANGYSHETFLGFVQFRGLAPNWVESQGGPQDRPDFHFPDPERFLRELASRPREELRPSERLTLDRAHALRIRMGTPEPEA